MSMSDSNSKTPNANAAEVLVQGMTAALPAPETPVTESVTEQAKVMRIGSMVKQLLEEVRTSQLDASSRERLAEIYER